MTQFDSLSTEVQTLINKYVNGSIARSPFDSHILKKLLVSVYAETANADSELIQILKSYIIDLSEYYTRDDVDVLIAEFPSLAVYCHQHDDVFYDTSNNREASIHTGFRRENPDYITPKSLVDLCLNMSECKPGSRIYLPFAGTCSFALYQSSNCTFDTDEINEEVWAYSKILLLSQGISANMKRQDCLIREIADSGNTCFQDKYDYIFSCPPILGGREERYVANTFRFLAEKSLNDDGEIYCILPMSFCYGREWYDFRQSILKDSNNKYSAIVISLPAILQPYTSIKLVLLCLKKDGKGHICLMDATGDTFCATKDLAGWKKKTLKPDSIIETIQKRDEQFVWFGDTDMLSDEVNLQPSRYLINNFLPKAKKGEELFKLGSVVCAVPLIRDSSSNTNIPLIGMKELSSSYINCEINRNDIPLSNKREYRIITTDCLLISFMGGKFKVGRVHGASPKTPIALRNEVLAIQLNSDKITEDYLLRCVMSPETELQASKMSTGVTISRLSLKDILSIYILVPNLISQQEYLCKEDTRSSLKESDRKLLESAESFRRDIHMKKHAIGQTIFNLNNWMRVLQRARRDGNGIVDDNAMVGTVHKTKVADIYLNLQSIIQELQTKINKLDSGYGMQSSDISLSDFVEEYIANNPNPVFRFVFDSSEHQVAIPMLDDDSNVTFIDDSKEYVRFPKEALTIIFDNIINNACCHGFENTANPKNMVKIEILSEGENYVITVSNNGKPLEAGYESEKVLTYGVSSKEGKGHYGIGGYEVRKLMREFDGDAELNSTPQEEFTITYRLIFKNSNIVLSI